MDGLLLANPLTWVAVGVAALGVAVYELYEHWSAITKYFEAHPWLIKLAEGILALAFPVIAAPRLIYDHWNQIKAIFTGAWDWMKTAGFKMMKSLGEGIASAAEYPFKAAWHIAEKIGRITIGNSPPPEGPLHYLDRPGLMETFAGSFHPAPIIRAATRVAAAVAVAAPMMTGAAMAGSAAGAPAATSQIIHYAPVVNGTGLGEKELLRVLERHAHDLKRILDREDERRERTRF
jgi:hypothetical protein